MGVILGRLGMVLMHFWGSLGVQGQPGPPQKKFREIFFKKKFFFSFFWGGFFLEQWSFFEFFLG